jgi:lipopolysaccharide transport system ATP-binding protein
MKNNNNPQIGELVSDTVIAVRNVSKTFRVPHRKIDSLRNAFVNIFAPNTYEEYNALNDISFDVKKGEFLGIIGRNGAGKSTLLKTLAGIYRPDRGKITINGRISPFLELGIGFNPELSGRDNVYLNATVLGLTKTEIDEKFDEIVAFAELEEFIDQQLKNYSSGMQARLAFSVSIHADREILLMDEVLAVGDSNFQQKCLDIFKGYKELGKTVVLVTHSMATVREYCDRALLFDKGELMEAGTVDEVCDAYIRNNLTKEERRELEKREKSENKEKKHRESLKNKKHGNWMMKKCEIDKNDIVFMKGNKVSSRTFYSGEDIVVSIKIDKRFKSANELHFGIALYSKNGAYLTGSNTFDDEIKHSVLDKIRTSNIIEYMYSKNILKKGSYYVRIAFFDSNRNNVIGVLEKSNLFEIIDNDKSGGSIKMLYQWN